MTEGNQQSPTGDMQGMTLGQYEIDGRLGQGGMATVYLAHQRSIDRVVAIKVLPQHFMHDPNFLQRFEREVKTIARLQHPRILPVYDYGEFDGRPYIVMAYMPGGTLADLIKSGEMELEAIVKLVHQIAEGLDHAHKEGVVHRDFKPSNVLIDQSNNAFLADFGIAKVSESTVALTGSGVVGTPAYMAPEMATDGIVTPQVDVYALGVTLYQMLTGKFPFQGDTPLRVMMAHANDPIPDILSERPDLPAPLAAVVSKALAKDPMDRYQTAGELAKALEKGVKATQSDVSYKDIAQQPLEATLLETPPASPTPMSAGTPVAAASPVAGTAPRHVAAPVVEATEEKRGCRTWMFVVAGIVALVGVCGGVLLLGGGMSAMSGLLNPTETPRPTDPPPTATDVPTATAAPIPSKTPDTSAIDDNPPIAGGDYEMEFVNDSDRSICYIYFVESNDLSSWGDDQLGSDIVAVGDTFTLTGIPGGNYDVATTDCDHNIISWNYELDIFENKTLTVYGSVDELIVVNESGQDICFVHISLPSAETWGRSQLPDEWPIVDGQERRIAATNEIWDLRVETCDGQFVEEYEVDLTDGLTWTIEP